MNPSADSQNTELSRRHFLKSGVGTLAVGATAGIVTQGVAQAQTAAAPAAGSDLGNYTKSGFPAANLGSVRDSLEKLSLSDELICTTQQPVYVLPRDHKFHGGQFYATNHFWEWHYFSGFAKDAAGNEYALFFGTDPVGYDPKTGGYAFLPAVVSISPIKEGKKYY